MTVAEIAAAVGYSDSVYFALPFRRVHYENVCHPLAPLLRLTTLRSPLSSPMTARAYSVPSAVFAFSPSVYVPGWRFIIWLAAPKHAVAEFCLSPQRVRSAPGDTLPTTVVVNPGVDLIRYRFSGETATRSAAKSGLARTCWPHHDASRQSPVASRSAQLRNVQ